jgi:tRNA threonylcarbamoyladenosine biosynthesis protein TsaB
MLRLIFSLTSQFLFLSLLEDKKCLISEQKENFRQHSENFFPLLRQTLAKNGCSLQDIEEVYFTSSPGSQTGHRISLAFGLTFQILNPKVRIYHLNSLFFQAAKDKTISLISIDQKKTKYRCAVYQDAQCLVEPRAIKKLEISQIQKQFPNYHIYEDFYQKNNSKLDNSSPKKINFLANFRQLLPYFQLLKNKEFI